MTSSVYADSWRTGTAPSMARALRLVCLGVTVGTAYYAGSVLGLVLKLPDATPSVMWPPNAILTSVLLLTPARIWPVALLSALPAHVALQTAAGWPLGLVIALFGTNCSEALMAAGGLRWLSDAPLRFDSLRRVIIFFAVVVFGAPFLSSFADAGAVSLVQGEPFWNVWIARLFSNTLTALVVVPAVIMAVRSGWRWVRSGPRLQHLEAAVIAGAMLLVGVLVLSAQAPGQGVVAAELAEGATLAWLLPFLLWAAIRLGPAGVSIALLASALVLVGAAVHSHGPFQGLTPEATTLALQVYLIVISVPLMIVAALMEERKLVQQDVSDRLALEALLARLSGAFVKLPSDRMRDVFGESLRQIGESLGLDAVLLLAHAEPGRRLVVVAAWNAPGADAARRALEEREFTFLPDLRQEPVVVEETGDPGRDDGGGGERAGRSDVGIPLIAEGRVLGVLACRSSRSISPRESGLLEELRLVARVLANALARKSTEDSLRASEAMKSAILSSLTYGVVVIDRSGSVMTINRRWRQLVREDAVAARAQVGTHYLELFGSAFRAGAVWASKAAEGIAAVLAGASREFRLEYVRPTSGGDRAIAIRALPLNRPEGGAVITQVDLTDQRRAELEAQRARAELAHVSRVATLGALTASIAHQLNQPLTGILANAQAARRFLSSGVPDLDEARLILDDIMEDNRRASEVIVRMREFLRKDTGELEDVELHGIIRDVVRLVSSDAIIRNVAIVLELTEGPAVVHGDHVQLQQVVLNLLVNALEALGEQHTRDRRVVVRSTRAGYDAVEISVIDNGPGFDCPEDSAFEALYTTKPGGMGLGLSIARSIVEAHAGDIRATRTRDGGATVTFRLPLALLEAT